MLVIGDGAPGLWAVLSEFYSGTRHDPLEVHKAADVLSHLPRACATQAQRSLVPVLES
ncbi:hypothetical protein MPNT_400001 [Candidatus Methylacidithermus pantelleriae]|uniref:Uncharacterized protein n=1 Tax=Candidatus Methylacidithermus pantelleriae TaxID=2744239 RepID=A0A8J2BV68_9BACT|nr:hypothetical protein MPNT_400001 [Candidatus Methylacidithermus pantelleriae]